MLQLTLAPLHVDLLLFITPLPSWLVVLLELP
jgi:hypothetical protein